MDLGAQLILLVIFGIVGFITGKIVGINPYRILSDTGSAIFILSLTFFVFPLSSDPNLVAKNLENMIEFFAKSLPSIIIGDVAGTFVYAITGER